MAVLIFYFFFAITFFFFEVGGVFVFFCAFDSVSCCAFVGPGVFCDGFVFVASRRIFCR